MDEPGFTGAAGLRQARVAIAGLGLMGGSLALALRGQCRELIGVDVDPNALSLALARGAVDRVADFEAAAAECDLLVLAAPVRAIVAVLGQLAGAPRAAGRAVVLDLGSTKTEVVRAMQALPERFDPLGGHPMCGKEVTGLANADASLFLDRLFVLTPLARTSPRALSLALALVAAIGARPLQLTPERHDDLAALASHLPYSAAVLLVGAAEALGDEQVWQMAASGFRDTSRLAASDVTMMVDILLTNKLAIQRALALYQAQLDELARRLDAADADGLRDLLAAAQARRSELFQ